jgi:hypothetical protein
LSPILALPATHMRPPLSPTLMLRATITPLQRSATVTQWDTDMLQIVWDKVMQASTNLHIISSRFHLKDYYQLNSSLFFCF